MQSQSLFPPAPPGEGLAPSPHRASFTASTTTACTKLAAVLLCAVSLATSGSKEQMDRRPLLPLRNAQQAGAASTGRKRKLSLRRREGSGDLQASGDGEPAGIAKRSPALSASAFVPHTPQPDGRAVHGILDSRSQGEGTTMAGCARDGVLAKETAFDQGEGIGQAQRAGEADSGARWTCFMCNSTWVVISFAERQRHLERCLCLSHEPDQGMPSDPERRSHDYRARQGHQEGHASANGPAAGDGVIAAACGSAGGAAAFASAATSNVVAATEMCNLCGKVKLPSDTEDWLEQHQAACLSRLVAEEEEGGVPACCNLCGRSFADLCAKDRWDHQDSCLRQCEAAGWDSAEDAAVIPGQNVETEGRVAQDWDDVEDWQGDADEKDDQIGQSGGAQSGFRDTDCVGSIPTDAVDSGAEGEVRLSDELEQWLEMLGLCEFRSRLKDHDVTDLACLSMLSDADLEEMGLSLSCPSVALLSDAVAALRTRTTAAPVAVVPQATEGSGKGEYGSRGSGGGGLRGRGLVTDYFMSANPRTKCNTKPISLYFGGRPPPAETTGNHGQSMRATAMHQGRPGSRGRGGTRGGSRSRAGMWSANRITTSLVLHHSVPGAPTFTVDNFNCRHPLVTQYFLTVPLRACIFAYMIPCSKPTREKIGAR